MKKILIAVLALALSACATYYPNTQKAGFYSAERDCKNERQLSTAGGALVGGGSALGLHALLNQGALSGSALVGGALIGGAITHFDNEAKLAQCLKQKGY